MQNVKNDIFNLQSIRLFLELLDTKHLGMTADRLGLTTATASRRLEALRQYFDDDLFVVRGRGLQPTPFAVSLEENLREAEKAVLSLTAPRAFDPKAAEKNFRLASRGLFESSLNTYLIRELLRSAPRCTLTHVCRTASSYDDLRDGKLDFVIGLDINVPSGLRYCRLFPLEVGVLCSSKHPLVRQYGGRAPTEEDFHKYSRIEIRLNPVLQHLSIDMKVAGVDRGKVVGSTNEPLAATEVVAKTDLLVLTPKVGAVAVGETTDVTWMPLPETLQREAIANAVLVWTEENHRDPTNIWLREHIKSWAKAMLERCDAR